MVGGKGMVGGKMGLRNYSTNLFLSSKNESVPELNVLVYKLLLTMLPYCFVQSICIVPVTY